MLFIVSKPLRSDQILPPSEGMARSHGRGACREGDVADIYPSWLQGSRTHEVAIKVHNLIYCHVLLISGKKSRARMKRWVFTGYFIGQKNKFSVSTC